MVQKRDIPCLAASLKDIMPWLKEEMPSYLQNFGRTTSADLVDVDVLGFMERYTSTNSSGLTSPGIDEKNVEEGNHSKIRGKTPIAEIS